MIMRLRTLDMLSSNIPAFELSARNVKELSGWIMNCASSPNLLLDTNNQISPNKRILPLIHKSSRQKHIFNALATQAQTFCNKWLTLVGPSSPKHQSNILTGWISSCTRLQRWQVTIPSLDQCTMLLSPCKIGNREFDSDYHHRPHFPAVLLFQTEIFGDYQLRSFTFE